MKKLLAVLVGILVASTVFAALLPSILRNNSSPDTEMQCYKSEQTGWECVRGFQYPSGAVRYQVVGVNPRLTQFVAPARFGDLAAVKELQVKLNGLNGLPGNNELAQAGWATESLYDGGCWVSGTGQNFVVAQAESCDELGGEGYFVLGFETIPRGVYRYGTFGHRFDYSLGDLLPDGFYFVKPLVTRDGSPVELGGDGSGDYSLYLSEVGGPIYFGIAPEVG